jgi:hypothetical protein
MSITAVKPIAIQPSTDQSARPSQPARWPTPSPSQPDAPTTTAPKFTCANCDMELVGRPTIHVGVAFCCAGCVAGGPCTCSYDEILEAEPQPTVGWTVHDCLDVSAFDEERQTARSR